MSVQIRRHQLHNPILDNDTPRYRAMFSALKLLHELSENIQAQIEDTCNMLPDNQSAAGAPMTMHCSKPPCSVSDVLQFVSAAKLGIDLHDAVLQTSNRPAVVPSSCMPSRESTSCRIAKGLQPQMPPDSSTRRTAKPPRAIHRCHSAHRAGRSPGMNSASGMGMPKRTRPSTAKLASAKLASAPAQSSNTLIEEEARHMVVLNGRVWCCCRNSQVVILEASTRSKIKVIC